MKPRITFALAALIGATTLATGAVANPYDDMVHLRALPGWRDNAGQHHAALELTLAPGWKTYWRAPGDAGIPPSFDWRGSRNMSDVVINWPVPVVFSQNGMRSVGYKRQLVLPLTVSPKRTDRDIRLHGNLQIGICKDICVPVELDFTVPLNTGETRPDPAIIAAMADRPLTAQEARVGKVTCEIGPAEDGLSLRAEMRMPTMGHREHVVIETNDPLIWVAESESQRHGSKLVAQTTLMHMDGGSFSLDRSGVRITVIGGQQTVDIRGCDAR